LIKSSQDTWVKILLFKGVNEHSIERKQVQIYSQIICDSVSPNGSRLVTFEIEYPRLIHAEILTHKMLSKNSQSSRAVPVTKTLDANKDFVKPLIWGLNKAGMQSQGELTGLKLYLAKTAWSCTANIAFMTSKLLSRFGLHKQWSNRITEPFSNIKVVISGTEWDNFFWLRIDDAAQPEIQELARLMKKQLDESTPTELEAGEWHIPYVACYKINSKQVFFDADEKELTEQEALKISASCCAQVSYRKLDTSKKKAIEIYDKLFSSSKPHYSPTEHQGYVMNHESEEAISHAGFGDGVTHIDKNLNYWSANFKGFVQYRKLLEEDKE
jgi:thymidylate synthase ThyX